MQVELIADYNNITGECPLWHPQERKIFWVDIPAGKLFSYDPETKEHKQIHQGRSIGAFTLQENGDLLCFRDKGNVVILNTIGQEKKTIIESIPAIEETRFNDVIAAPDGSVFAGTISCPSMAGCLYHIKTDGSYELVLEGQGTPNGMGFSKDEKTFYYQDSRKQSLWSFEYDLESGNISNGKILRVANEMGDRGRGDGLTIDNHDLLWSARYEGGCVIQADVDGVPQAHYDVPAKNVTCCTFGGDDYGDMYITSAGGDDKEKNGSGAGALFCIKTKTQGKPEYRSKLI